jgi:hypothetical protein
MGKDTDPGCGREKGRVTDTPEERLRGLGFGPEGRKSQVELSPGSSWSTACRLPRPCPAHQQAWGEADFFSFMKTIPDV